MSNTSNNIKKTEQQISLDGNLHEAVVSEYYDNGVMSYVFDGYVYWSNKNSNSLSTNYVLNNGVQISNDKIYKASDIYLNNNTTSPTEKLNPRESYTYSDLLFLPSKYYKNTESNTREYRYVVNSNTATGLYKTFIEGYLSDPTNIIYQQYIQILDFSIAINQSAKSSLDPLSPLFDQFYDSNGDIDGLTNVSPFDITVENDNGQLQPDKTLLLSSLSTKQSQLLNVVTTSQTPMQQYLNGTKTDADGHKLVDDKGKPYVDWRKFNSLNITSTSGGNYFKVIESNPNDTIDKMVLFNDQDGLKGNQLFSQDNWAPFNVDPIVDGLTLNFRDVINFEMPTYNDLLSKDLNYFTVLHNRFKYMSSGIMSHTPGSENKNEQLFDNLAAWDQTENEYMDNMKKSKTHGIGKDYNSYQTGLYQKEDIIFSANGQITFNWSSTTKIETCVISNWTTNFAILNPEYMKENKKNVIQPKYFLEFEPFNLWFVSSYNRAPNINDINNKTVGEWFNTLNKEELDFWILSSESESFDYKIINNKGEQSPEKCVVQNYKGIPKESILDVGGYIFIVWGCGITPDFIFPVVDLSHPTPNPKKEALVYVNDVSYSNVQIGYANSPTENYLVLDFNVKKELWQNILNMINKFTIQIQMTLPSGINAAYMAKDTTNVLNASAYRIAYIPKLINSIDIVTWILCAFITLLAILICIVVVKRYIDSNRNNIGVMLANGITKNRIVLSLLPFALVPAFIGGVAAYLFGLFLQIPALGLFSAYWMLPTATIAFNIFSLIGAVLLPFFVFALITTIVAFLALRTDPVTLMKAGSEFKINFFSKMVKRPFSSFGIIFRFRVSLAFNSLWRLLVLAMMCMLTMSALVFSFTTFGKLASSQIKNASTYDYDYAIELATPTINGGPYKDFDYLKNSGVSDPTTGLFNFYWNEDKNSDYQHFVKPYYNLDPGDEYVTSLIDGAKQYGNLFMPLANDVNGQNQDLFYLQNKFSSKLTMNYGMGVGSMTSNPWDIALALMPVNTNNLTAQAWINVVNLMGKKVYTAEKGSNYWHGSSDTNDYIDFLIPSGDINDEKTTYILNTKKILGTIATRLNPVFAKLITVAYQDQEILDLEYPILYGQVPLYVAAENSEIKSDEKYSYISGEITELNNNKTASYDHDIKIYGIKQKSEYINLLNKKNEKINDLLFVNEDSSQPYPIIANSFAQHKYDLSIGDVISINPKNKADRIIVNIDSKQSVDTQKENFIVVGISQGTQDEEYYTTQKIANKILMMPDGDSWNGMNQYTMWYDDVEDISANYRLFNSNGQTVWPTNDNLKKNDYSSSEVEKIPGEELVDVPVGFNGVFTQRENGGYILHSLCLYSYSGMYPPTNVYEMEQTKKVLKYGNNLALCNEITGIKDKAIFDSAEEYYKNRTNPSADVLENFNNAIQSMVDQLIINYGNTTMFTTMNNVIDIEAMDQVYSTFIGTINVAQACVLSIVIPMSIIIVLLISSMIIGDSKKIAAMLKSLGYSDRENAMSFMAIYIPVIIIGLACAIPLAMGITLAYQALLFTTANILVDVTISWWYYGLAMGAIVLLLGISYSASYVALKKDRLVDQIK